MSRISFGVQSFVDEECRAVGRLHTRRECEVELARVRGAGVEGISLDLIAGLPHQTAESWMFSVEQAIASEVPHVSVYLLEVDDESRLGREMLELGIRYGAGAVPCEDETAEWYLQACEALGADDVEQYEISNFARRGHRSRHNLKYWQRQPYLGFGLDAHSMLERGKDAVRFANAADLDAYMGASQEGLLSVWPGASRNVNGIEHEEAFEETLFLGLRLNEGVDLRLVRERFGEDLLRDAMPALAEVRDAGLLEFTGEWMRLTSQGRLLSNEVFSRLLMGDEETQRQKLLCAAAE
jgi:oxygen-independent coproporphyrinogen-3 oxidase